MFSGILEEKWRMNRRGWVGPAVAHEAKRLALGEAGLVKSHVEIMDFEGNVLSKFRTKIMQQIEITSDASKVYLLSGAPTGKIFAYDSSGEKLKKYKYGGRQLSISEDGSMVTAGDALMDAEGNVIRFSTCIHMVIDALSGKLEQKAFIPIIVGIAPNGNYVVAHEWTIEGKSPTFDRHYTTTYRLNNIYMRPQETNSLGALLGWKCVSFNLKNTDIEPQSWYKAKVCAHNSFFASARKSIGYIDLNGNLKWAFTLPHRDEIRQFYVTPDAKYVFFTLKGRKKKKNIYILDAENRKIVVKALENHIVNFKVSNDGKTLFVSTSIHQIHPLHMPKAELVAFDVRRKLLQQILGG